jgi:hypothetical protein
MVDVAIAIGCQYQKRVVNPCQRWSPPLTAPLNGRQIENVDKAERQALARENHSPQNEPWYQGVVCDDHLSAEMKFEDFTIDGGTFKAGTIKGLDLRVQAYTCQSDGCRRIFTQNLGYSTHDGKNIREQLCPKDHEPDLARKEKMYLQRHGEDVRWACPKCVATLLCSR